jgi:hypothetical protein
VEEWKGGRLEGWMEGSRPRDPLWEILGELQASPIGPGDFKLEISKRSG